VIPICLLCCAQDSHDVVLSILSYCLHLLSRPLDLRRRRLKINHVQLPSRPLHQWYLVHPAIICTGTWCGRGCECRSMIGQEIVVRWGWWERLCVRLCRFRFGRVRVDYESPYSSIYIRHVPCESPLHPSFSYAPHFPIARIECACRVCTPSTSHVGVINPHLDGLYYVRMIIIGPF